jgi:hypothetical protein
MKGRIPFQSRSHEEAGTSGHRGTAGFESTKDTHFLLQLLCHLCEMTAGAAAGRGIVSAIPLFLV